MKSVKFFPLLCLAMMMALSCRKDDPSVCEAPLPQTVVSSCEDAQGITPRRLADAERLAMRLVRSENLPAMDSLFLPVDLVDEILGDLIAIEQALDRLNCPDVLQVKDIYTWESPELHELVVGLDTSYAWTEAWINGQLITGNPMVDSLVSSFGLGLAPPYPGMEFAYTALVSPEAMNILKLMQYFEGIPGIIWLSERETIGSGDDLRVRRFPFYNRYEFSYGMGDCPSGCTEREIRTFRVYPDCSVEYEGISYWP